MLVVSVTRIDVFEIPLHLTFIQSKQYCSGKNQLNKDFMLTDEKVHLFIQMAEFVCVFLSLILEFCKH